MIKKNDYEFFFKNTSRINILVLGDLMVDRYLYGSVKRISPEAPVPILHYDREESFLGGAGNVFLNLSNFKVKTYIASVIGIENRGNKILLGLLKKGKINTNFIVREKGRKPSIKTRVVSDNQQIVRIDEEDLHEVKKASVTELLKKISASKIKFDAIIFSDYGKGIINSYSFKLFLAYAKNNKIYTALDPKQRNFSFYKGVDLMTPNNFEASQAVGQPCESDEEVSIVARKILRNFGLKEIILTRGNKGLAVFQKSKKGITKKFFPTFNRTLYDVTGAGDTVIATSVLAHLIFTDIVKSAFFSNICAGIVVSKFGVSVAKEKEVIKEIDEYHKA